MKDLTPVFLTMSIKVIDAETVQRTLSMSACIDLMADTQLALSQGRIELPLRSIVPISGADNFLCVMPGENENIFGAKMISLFPTNPGDHDKPAIQGYIILFSKDTGTPIALIDAASVTAIRTAAASAAATRVLAQENARTLALLGYGVQADSHLEAMCAIRPIDEVRIWGRSIAKARKFVAKTRAVHSLNITAVAECQQAVSGADIICAISGAPDPIIQGHWVAPGTHVNLVGAHTATTREADSELIQRARVFTEVNQFALAEAGDLIIPIAAGEMSKDDIVGEIGAVIEGNLAGRLTERDITVYKSLGNTAQDLAAAHYIYANC